MSTVTATECPTWCAQHSSEDGILLHERRVNGDRWDFILSHDADDGGTTVDIGLPSDRGLSPSEALTLGHALIEAAATVGQAAH